MPTISFKSWELKDQEAALQKLIMEFVGTDQKRARLIVEALSSLKHVYIRVPMEREIEFAEKMKEVGRAHLKLRHRPRPKTEALKKGMKSSNQKTEITPVGFGKRMASSVAS